MNLLLHILKALWLMHPQRFWLVWLPSTTTSLIYVKSMVGHLAATPQRARKSSIDVTLIRDTALNPTEIITLISASVFLVSYIAILLVWEDFSEYDNDAFMRYTLRGRNYPTPIWQDSGRFFPFSMQDFNLVRHFTNTPTGYHSISLVQILILVGILLVLDSELGITGRVGLAVLTLLTPSILISFNGLIYPERNVIFFLACILLAIKQFDNTKAVGWALATIVCAQIMIYYKETAFLLLLGFATGRLILRCRNEEPARWHWERLYDLESRLDWCLAVLALLFLFSYFAVMGIHGNMNYAAVAHRPRTLVLLSYLKLDLLAWLFVAAVLGRVCLVFRQHRAPWLTWDALALGGVAYFVAYLYLGMLNCYYLAPVDFIAVLYVGRLVLLSWNNLGVWVKVAGLSVGFVVVLQDVSLSAFATFERKNVIHGKAEIASVIEERWHSGSGKVPSLFFPFAKPYPVMEFLVYLQYRGLPINDAALAKKNIAKDGRCVDYDSTTCHAASRPVPGDLVIVLPDDVASMSEVSIYREQGTLLCLYGPRPAIPHWVSSLFGRIPLVGHNDDKVRPDRWMDGSVTLWR